MPTMHGVYIVVAFLILLFQKANWMSEQTEEEEEEEEKKHSQEFQTIQKRLNGGF